MATKKKSSTKKRGENTPGRKRGRKPDPASKSAQVRALLGSGMSAADIAEQVGCTVGLVYVIKSTSGMAKKRASRRGPGRPRKARAAASGIGASRADLSGLDGILAAVKGAEQERTQMRTALERIQAVVAGALA